MWSFKTIHSFCMTDSFDRNYNIICQCLSGCFLGNLNTDQLDYFYGACPYPNMHQ